VKRGAGLFLLWFIASTIWMIGWTIHMRTNCGVLPPSRELICRPEELSLLLRWTGKSTFSFTEAALWGVSVPALTLAVLAVAVAWARRAR
jgi:hypothetical protein